jgi:hypothetical protein
MSSYEMSCVLSNGVGFIDPFAVIAPRCCCCNLFVDLQILDTDTRLTLTCCLRGDCDTQKRVADCERESIVGYWRRWRTCFSSMDVACLG